MSRNWITLSWSFSIGMLLFAHSHPDVLRPLGLRWRFDGWWESEITFVEPIRSRNSTLFDIFRHFRNETTLAIRNSKISYFKNVFETNRNSLHKLWREISKIELPKSKVPRQIDMDTNELNQFFVSALLSSDFSYRANISRFDMSRWLQINENVEVWYV